MPLHACVTHLLFFVYRTCIGLTPAAVGVVTVVVCLLLLLLLSLIGPLVM